MGAGLQNVLGGNLQGSEVTKHRKKNERGRGVQRDRAQKKISGVWGGEAK